MREHFGIDRLIEYGTAPVDETVKVVNPAYRDIESRIRSVGQKLGRKVSEFGQTTLELESKNIVQEDEEMKKYVIKKSQLQEIIELYRNEIAGLKEQRKQIEKNIEIGELPECEKYSSLMNEKKHIVDTIKMIDYRAETAMATMIQPELSQRKTTRVLLRQIFSTEVDLEHRFSW
jgi:predicted nuclease with TOPRIM domain